MTTHKATSKRAETSKESRDRLRALGFTPINIWVPEEDAELMKAKASLVQAKATVDFIDGVRITADGIEDERFDHMMTVQATAVPTIDTLTQLGAEATTEEATKDCNELKEMLYGFKRLLIEAKSAERRYEEAEARDKYDAALEARLAGARAYALGKLLRARVKLHRAKFGGSDV